MADNSFVVQSKLLRELSFAPNKQAAWGTALPAAVFTRVQRFDGSAVIDFGTERRSDKMMSGKGFSFATNSQPTMFSVKISGIKCEATDWITAWALSNLMGSLVTTGAGVPYTHTITYDETTRTAIPTSMYMKDTNDVAYILGDMVVTSATITVTAKGALSFEFDMIGTGYKIPGVIATVLTVPAETYLMGNDALLNWGPVGNPVNFLGRHMSSTIKIENQAVVHEAPGGGLQGIFVRRGDPKFSVSSVVAAKNVDDVLFNFLANNLVSYNLSVPTAANCALTLSIPSANLKTTKLGFDSDMPVWNIDIDETTCYDVGGVEPLNFAINSTQPSFMTVPV